MMYAQLNLIIPVFVQSENRYKLISLLDTEYKPPVSVIQPYDDIYAIADMLIKRYTTNYSGFNLKFTDVISTDTLNIFLLCFINYDISLSDCFLINIDSSYEFIPKNAKKTLSLLAR